MRLKCASAYVPTPHRKGIGQSDSARAPRTCFRATRSSNATSHSKLPLAELVCAPAVIDTADDVASELVHIFLQEGNLSTEPQRR